MRESDPFAGNLLSRLFSYTPREGEKRERSPLEDFCTEALAWCLLNSQDFAMSFLDLIDISSAKSGNSQVEVHTQWRYDEKPDEDSPGESDAGRFDMVLLSKGSQDFAVIVEVKTWSRFSDQLARYRTWLGNRKKGFGNFHQTKLVTLTPLNNKPAESDVHIQWCDVDRLLIDPTGNIENEKKLVFNYFSTFLKQKALCMENIPAIPNEILERLPDLRRALNDLSKIIKQLVASEMVKAKRKMPAWEFDDSKDASWSWLGVYTSNPADGYVGVGFHDDKNEVPVLWAEFSITGDRHNDLNRANLKGVSEVEDADGRTFIKFKQPLDKNYNGQADKILHWFNEQIQQIRDCQRYLDGKK